MGNALISLDEQQIIKVEQIIMEQDESGALKYLEDLRKLVKRSQVGCNPLEFRAREGVGHIIDKTRKARSSSRVDQ